MTLIEQNQDFYNLVEEWCEDYGVKVGNYDLFTHKTINEIFKKDENGKYINHPKEKWEEYIKDTDNVYREKQIQQIAIARHPLLSDEMAKEILKIKNINKTTLKSLLNRNDLTYSTIKETYNLLKLQFPFAMNELFQEKESKLGKDAIKIITIDAVDEISNTGKPKNRAQEFVFLHTKENALIKEFLSAEGSNIPEDILSNIASNENLLSSIRETAFDIGCNWEKVSNFTTKMSENIYHNIVAYPFNDNSNDFITTDPKEKERLFYFSMDTLKNFIISECLPVANRRDLLNRLSSVNPNYSDRMGGIFVHFIDHEKDAPIIKNIAEELEFFTKDSQLYLTHLLMNPEFQKTEMFDRAVGFLFTNVYNEKLCDEKIVDNLIKSLYAYPCDWSIQLSIIDETLKNKEKEMPKDEKAKSIFKTQRKIQEDVLMALLHSKNTSAEAYVYLMNHKLSTPDLFLLGHFGVSCQKAYGAVGNIKMMQHIKETFFKCIRYNPKNKCFMVNVKNKSEYKLVLKVLKTAKENLPKKHMIKNKLTLSNIESLVKQQEKQVLKNELMDKLFTIEEKVADLSKKDISDFYIHICDLQKEFIETQEQIKELEKGKKNIIDNEKDISQDDNETR